MRRMFSEKQIKEMISAGAQSEIAEALEGDIEIGGDLSVTGDAEVGGDLSVTGDISGDNITGNSIIENMSGYVMARFTSDMAWDNIYSSIVKNGNKLTLVIFGSLAKTDDNVKDTADIISIQLPDSVMVKLFPYTIAGEDRVLSCIKIGFQSSSDRETNVAITAQVLKTSTPRLMVRLFNARKIVV